MPLIKPISVSGSIPTITQLALGDLAINTFDGKAYIKKYAEGIQTIIELGSGISISSSYALSSSYASTSSYSIFAQNAFPYTGSALITGSLGVTGSFSTTDTVFLKGIINQTTPVSHVVTFDNTTGRLYITASSAFGGGGGGGSTPGGNFDTIQFNNAGVLDGSDNFKLVGGNTVLLTGSLLLSSSFIDEVQYVKFDVDTTQTPSLAQLNWNQTDKTLEFGTGDGDTFLQIGQETVYPPVVNKDTVDLGEGTLVMVDPNDIAQGNRIRVIRAISDGTYPSQYLVGVLTEDIPQNQEGYATWFGYVRNLNIPTLESSSIKPSGESWAEGDVLYPNAAVAGGLSYSASEAPALNGTIGVITAINGNNLTMLVRPTFTFTLTELTNVRTRDVEDGSLLVRSGSIWISTHQLTGSYGLTGSLSVSGSITGSITNAVSASYALTASYLEGYVDPFPYTGSAQITGSFSVTGSTTLYKSGSTVLDVQGSQGQLFSVVDALSGSLMSVNDISGLPILEVFSDDRVVLGTYGAPGLTVTGSLFYGTGSVTGSLTGSLLGTASYANQAKSASYSINSLLLNSTASSVFATTGSNVFKGDQVISGSFKSTGSFEVKSDSVDLYGSTNIILNSTNIVAPVLPFAIPPGGANLNTVLIDANNGVLYVTSSLPGTGGGGGGLPDRIITGSITASVADGSSPTNPNFFLLQSGSSEMLKFNTDRVMVLETRTDTPTAVTGGIFYSASGDFYFGL